MRHQTLASESDKDKIHGVSRVLRILVHAWYVIREDTDGPSLTSDKSMPTNRSATPTLSNWSNRKENRKRQRFLGLTPTRATRSQVSVGNFRPSYPCSSEITGCPAAYQGRLQPRGKANVLCMILCYQTHTLLYPFSKFSTLSEPARVKTRLNEKLGAAGRNL